MKKFVISILLLLTLVPMIKAYDGEGPRMSPADFRAKQKEFIARDACLTDDEAARFFPIYFELQDKKHSINQKSFQLMHQADNDNLTEAQCKSIIDGIYTSRIAIDKLEKEYNSRFRRIITYAKILRVHRAEMRFNKFVIRQMRGKQQ